MPVIARHFLVNDGDGSRGLVICLRKLAAAIDGHAHCPEISAVYCVQDGCNFIRLRSLFPSFHLQSVHHSRPEWHVRSPRYRLDARNTRHAITNTFVELSGLRLSVSGLPGVCCEYRKIRGLEARVYFVRPLDASQKQSRRR